MGIQEVLSALSDKERRKILDILKDDSEYQFLMIDATHVKVHPDACGAVDGNQDMDRTKGGSTPKSI